MLKEHNQQYFEALGALSDIIDLRYPNRDAVSISLQVGESFEVHQRSDDSLRIRVISYDDRSGYERVFNFFGDITICIILILFISISTLIYTKSFKN